MFSLKIAREIAHALKTKRPVVALESTIIAHGLPWPENLEVALALESAVRRSGALPATIAVVDGRPRIGLAEHELEHLAKHGAEYPKAGAPDLAIHLARDGNAATTVSGTAYLAWRAGIRVFATGGIGGVHRGDEGDVSNDLATLAQTPIAVISAGAKAILDLPRTLEKLETLGVLVVGYRTSELPAFYSRTSGIPLEHRIDEVDRLARVLATRWELGQGGVLVCHPVPAQFAVDAGTIEVAIERALIEADAAHVSGKQLTPFLLSRLAASTEGALAANRALAIANAEVAGELAVAYQRHQ